MPDNASQAQDGSRINRRAYIAALASVGGVGLAGCGGGGDGGDGGGDGGGGGDGSGGDGSGGGGELGERVPQIRTEFYGGIPGLTETFADVAEILQGNIEEGIGVDMEVAPKNVGTLINQVFNDAREQNAIITADSQNPIRLDPNELLLGESVMSAGAGVGWTQTNYANCEYSELAHQQSQAASSEERRELVQEALSIASQDVVGINYLDYVTFTVYRSDEIEITADEYDSGPSGENPDLLLNHLDVSDGVRINASTEDYVSNPNWWPIDNPTAILMIGNTLYSPLVRYDKDRNIQNVLAEDYQVENDFQTVTVTIRDHVDVNGDPITAEDVKWTYEYLQEHSGEPGATVRAQEQPYDTIEVVDDRTVRFNFTEPNPGFETAHMPMWGIQPKDFWVEKGIEDGNQNEIDVDPDELVTHGPYKLETFTTDQFVRYVPNENHWNTPDYPLDFTYFQDRQSLIRAFEAGDINVFTGAGASYADTVEGMDNAASILNSGFTRNQLAPQHSFPPTKFRALRLAMSQCINRQEINEVVYYGRADPVLHSCIVGTNHPFYPEDDEGLLKIAESPTGDPDVAKQTLRDAGWGWDDNGNLHYPPDADLEPRWPQGETPADYPDKFPCVEELEL